MATNNNTNLKPEINESLERLNSLKDKYSTIPANELQRRSEALKEIKDRTSIIISKLGEKADTLVELNIIRRWIDIETIKLIEAKIEEAKSRKNKDNDDRDDI